ncbi:ankyrin repeat domain-containing protein [Verrucomicrobia bacterium]|nr:ankyrin repeat domain-containing protein [Verrucomicrobiota bacterium]
MNSHTFALLLSVFLGALIVGCGSPEEEIIKNGAAGNAINWNKSQLLSAIKRSDTALAIELINKGEDVNEKSSMGTLLHIAVRQNLKEIVELLITKGADVNAKAFQIGDDAEKGRGITPLHYAAIDGFEEIAKLLIESGAEVNANANGRTPLHFATLFNQKVLAEFLIANGADVNAKEDFGDSPLMVAVKRGNNEIIKLLTDKGADALQVYFNEKDSLLFKAANNTDIEYIAQQLEGGADVNVKNRYGMTLLHTAALSGDKNVIEFLIAKKGGHQCPE